MNDASTQTDELIVREHGSLRRITLSRPKALNALTLDMAVAMTELLREWADDPSVGSVLFDGAGDRAFCAGGDIRALYDAAKNGDPLPAMFWTTEYRLNVMIARYPKPIVALMDGLVMGGGVGLSAHAAHRIVTERSAIAMPEVGIGFFPDVGACYPLACAPGFVGTYLALTGRRANAADAIYCGLADVHVAAEKIAGLPDLLADCWTPDDVHAMLADVAANAGPSALEPARSWIDAAFGAADVETILARLKADGSAEAQGVLAELEKMSPTSLKITLRHLRDAAGFATLEDCYVQDLRIALACIAGHDFIEGIRAQIVDKDRNPHWQPDTLAGVTADIVDRHFQSLGNLELTFPD
jgi:enoyl-CoA hydratase